MISFTETMSFQLTKTEPKPVKMSWFYWDTALGSRFDASRLYL